MYLFDKIALLRQKIQPNIFQKLNRWNITKPIFLAKYSDIYWEKNIISKYQNRIINMYQWLNYSNASPIDCLSWVQWRLTSWFCPKDARNNGSGWYLPNRKRYRAICHYIHSSRLQTDATDSFLSAFLFFCKLEVWCRNQH